MPPSEYWLAQLKEWTRSGTFERLYTAIDAETTVRVRRSDGRISLAKIISASGYAGRSVVVEILDADPPLYKEVRTEQFLELNPGFGPSLIHLTPEDER